MDGDLIEQLNRLRTRAGNPSVRELAKLTERQGPGRAMSRSTVQDKLSRKNPPRLGQTLALVQACADYANSIGAPLPRTDTEEQVWRERTQAALAQTPSPSPADIAASHPPAREEIPAANPTPRWDLNPLIRAGMYDMVDLVQTNEDQPIADWLPILTEALHEAEMSNEQFLLTASRERPQDIASALLALTYQEEHEAADRLLYLCTRNQPAESIPMILALLRRRGERDFGINLANKLIDVIAGNQSRTPSNTGAGRHIDIVDALRNATMERDATRLLEGVGAHGNPDLALTLAASFPDTIIGDRERILGSVAKGSKYHLLALFKTLRDTAIDGIDPNKTRDRIIFGIPFGQHSEIVSFLKSSEYHEEADRVLDLEDQPPF